MSALEAIRGRIENPHLSPEEGKALRNQAPLEDSLFQNALSAIETGFQKIRDSYSDLASPWKRKAVRIYLATDPVVRRVEDAVSKQILIVRTAPTRASREEAARKVREGMEFWKRLILRKMESA